MSDAKNAMSPFYAITVAFELQDGTRERFLELIRANAAASVAEEPGCYRFDVLTPRAGGNGSADVLLYEIYADRAAFDAHVKSPHFLAFDAASRALVRSKRVTEFDAYENRKP
jgi:autoinducer 2-degrading protein